MRSVLKRVTKEQSMCTDLIRRSDAIKAFKKDYKQFWGTEVIIAKLQLIPVVEPKQGEWIEVESYECEKHSVTDMRCNLCGKYSQMVLPHKTKCVYPRCPFCGAIMKVVDDEVR